MKWNIFYRFLLTFLLIKNDFATCDAESANEFTQAYLNISYKDIRGGFSHFEDYGRYGKYGPFMLAEGNILHIPHQDWCQPFKVKGMTKPWIALIPRGNCTFKDKILVAKQNNASAVIVYDNEQGDDFTMNYQGTGSIVAVSITASLGTILASLVNSKTSVFVEIKVGPRYVDKRPWHVSRTSVLFVLVSFILLMCISLAWLVFYYVQRFRYFYARDKKEKLLLNAAKKAVSKLATKHYSEGRDKEHEETCAVCLENYKDGEVLRVLTCRHDFHKHCVDQWLLKHRTCPMCKMNILKALGVEIPGNAIDIESSEDHGYELDPGNVDSSSPLETGALNTPELEVADHPSEGASAPSTISIQVASTEDVPEKTNTNASGSTVALVTAHAV